MANRNEGNFHFHLVLGTEEYLKLEKLAKKNGFSKSQILRNLINDTPIPFLSEENVRDCNKELHKIGVNINQITAKYNSSGFLDMTGLRFELKNLDNEIANLFALITTAKLKKGVASDDWKDKVVRILEKSENPSDFLAECWKNSHIFCENSKK